ncbi:MAG TPA: hypothetical protein VHT21_03200 [Stellaceae bacterium]|nr:hypothetical protein [Stellaceae bacterium]
MRDVYVIGSFSTAFGRWAAKDHRALAKDAVLGVLQDAELADGSALGQAYFGNCLMHMIGQTMIRGQTCLSDLMEQGVLPERLPIINVEGACATGSLAFHLAWKDVLVGPNRSRAGDRRRKALRPIRSRKRARRSRRRL